MFLCISESRIFISKTILKVSVTNVRDTIFFMLPNAKRKTPEC